MAKEKNKDVNIHREWAKMWMGVALIFFGMGIVVYGLTQEPPGQIHESVVTTFGLVLTWAGTMFGMDSHSKIKMHEQDIEFESKRYEQDKYFETKKMELENEMRKFRFDRKTEEKDEEG